LTKPSLTLDHIANTINGALSGNPNTEISGVAQINDAQNGDISFVLERKYISKAKSTKASAIITFKKIEGFSNQIVVENPRKALCQTIALFSPAITRNSEKTSIASNATIDPDTKIGSDVTIKALSVIGKFF